MPGKSNCAWWSACRTTPGNRICLPKSDYRPTRQITPNALKADGPTRSSYLGLHFSTRDFALGLSRGHAAPHGEPNICLSSPSRQKKCRLPSGESGRASPVLSSRALNRLPTAGWKFEQLVLASSVPSLGIYECGEKGLRLPGESIDSMLQPALKCARKFPDCFITGGGAPAHCSNCSLRTRSRSRKRNRRSRLSIEKFSRAGELWTVRGKNFR